VHVRLERDSGVAPARPRGANTRLSRLPTPKARSRVGGDKIGMMAGLTGSITIHVPFLMPLTHAVAASAIHAFDLRFRMQLSPWLGRTRRMSILHSPLFSRLNLPHPYGSCCGCRFRYAAGENLYRRGQSGTRTDSGEGLVIDG
jgi:hypothetical protein